MARNRQTAALDNEAPPETPPPGTPPETTAEGEYGLHIRLAKEMQSVLQDSTQLAFKMGEIQKATLEELMNLFIVWGLAILRRKWQERMGYH